MQKSVVETVVAIRKIKEVSELKSVVFLGRTTEIENNKLTLETFGEAKTVANGVGTS
jgi:hypothetical protein